MIISEEWDKVDGGAEPLCDKDEYISGTSVNPFTNGQTVPIPSNSLIIFNCIDYTSVRESSAIGISIYGIGKGVAKTLSSESSTTNKDVTDYDYIIYNRGGSPASSLAITFS